MEKICSGDVLLVEDSAYDAELTIRALKNNNLANEIFLATDGEDALNFIFCRDKYANRENTRSIKVILLDLKLPKLNGLEVLKEIRANPKTAKIPVVIVSSSKEDPDIEKAYELGANSYVVKPVDFTDFVLAIERTGLFWLLTNEAPLI